MTTQQYDAELERKFALYEKRRLDSEPRPVVPLPEQLAARQHEYEIAEARRKRSERVVNVLVGVLAAVCAVALALGIWWRAL